MKNLSNPLYLLRHFRSGNRFIKTKPSFQNSVDQLSSSRISRSCCQSLFLPSLREDQDFGRISLQTDFMVQFHPSHFGEVVALGVEEKIVKQADRCLEGGRVSRSESFVNINQGLFRFLLPKGFAGV